MVFMPGDATVFEFRLKDYNVPLYEDMAHAIKLPGTTQRWRKGERERWRGQTCLKWWSNFDWYTKI